MKMNEKPKPCPFCGSAAGLCYDYRVICFRAERFAYIRCEGCGAKTGYWILDDEAIRAWNRRVKEDG